MHTIGIIMNGVTGRMGENQHLARSIVAMRKQGGLLLPGGETLMPDPILVGRNEQKLRRLAEKYGVERWSTDLTACLANPNDQIYFDAQVTSARSESLRAAIQAGKHIYCEKPTASSLAAAAHIVCDPLITTSHETFASLDWEATLAYRRHLWSCGLGVAEAMDTAQRGMGLGWSIASKLIRLSLAEARAIPSARIACGAGTDHLIFNSSTTIDDVENAYEEQCAFIEEHGGQIILMASRALAACARTPDDYIRVYTRILSQVRQPVILHWLGDMFDPALYGYWGSDDVESAMQTCLGIIRQNVQKVDGIKISLLDREHAAGHILGFHVSDWPVPLPDTLLGRAMMGDGVINLRPLRSAVEAAGC